jgi:LysR family transcriptional regulator, glycine cleavage system transcriptional activator
LPRTSCTLRKPRSASLALRRGLSFDQGFLALQAAIDGLGIALSKRTLVDADIVAGRLVVPFDVILPSDAGYYIVAPEETADTSEIALFRDWLLHSVTKATEPSSPRAPRQRKAARRESHFISS